MDACPEFERVSALIGGELDPYQQAEVTAHLQRCSHCRRQVAELSWLARSLEQVRCPERPAEGSHLTDMEVAAFATHSVPDEQFAPLQRHVAHCETCAALVAGVRRSLDEYEGVFGKEEAREAVGWWHRMWADFRQALSTWRGRLLMGGALVVFLGECGLFAFALAHLIVAVLLRDPMHELSPPLWPIRTVPPPPLQVAGVVLACGALALLLRTAAARLISAAVRAGRERERDA